MYIDGNETISDLKNFCSCQSCNQQQLVMDGSCIAAHLSDQCGDKNLCLGGLAIPISCAVEASKTIQPHTSWILDNCFCDHKFLAVYVKDNKCLYYRVLDKLSDNLNTVNYNFNIDIVTGDITGDKVDVIVDISLTPDNTTYVATWDGISTIYINGSPFINWEDADLSWFDIGATNISNSLLFSPLTGQLTGTILNDGEGNLPTKVISGNITDGSVNYYIELELSYDYNTTTFSYSIKKIELVLNEFIDDNITIESVDIDAVAASGSFNIVGSGYTTVGFKAGDSFIVAGETFTLGSEFVSGASDADTAQNLVDAINTNITTSAVVTATNGFVSGANGGGSINIVANESGVDGNDISISIAAGNNTASGNTLSGGIDSDTANTIDITDNIVTINMTGKFKTITAKRYKALSSVLILSSKDEMKLDNIEFYNNNGSEINLCLLTAE